MSPSEAGAHRDLVRAEFGRAAHGFAQRSKGRFDDLDVVSFSRPRHGISVAEIGAGAGNFLSLFDEVAALSIAVDLTLAMLSVGRRDHPNLKAIVSEGERLPLRSSSLDLVASAQVLHHVHQPVPLLEEMRRAVRDGGNVLIVDQVATDRFEEAVARNELEVLRDPSHASTRPPSAFHVMLTAAGLSVVDQRIVSSRQRVSKWMWPGEFPEERIAAVRTFIEERGAETGMDFAREGDDFSFTRRRLMLLAERAPGSSSRI